MTTSDARKRLAELRESSVASAGGLEEAIARAEVAEAERDEAIDRANSVEAEFETWAKVVGSRHARNVRERDGLRAKVAQVEEALADFHDDRKNYGIPELLDGIRTALSPEARS